MSIDAQRLALHIAEKLREIATRQGNVPFDTGDLRKAHIVDRERQNRMVAAGKSKTPWPKSKHNAAPSLAADVAAWPIDWNDRERQSLFAGYVLATAKAMGVSLRWGGDWDRDTEVKDNGFDDLVHFELVEAQEARKGDALTGKG